MGLPWGLVAVFGCIFAALLLALVAVLVDAVRNGPPAWPVAPLQYRDEWRVTWRGEDTRDRKAQRREYVN